VCVQVRGWSHALVLAALVAALGAAAAGAGAGQSPPARLVVDGKPTLRLWLATNEQTRALGVHRKPLRRGVGMWFGWPGQQTSSGFWMRGVSYPLLLVWVGGDGRVLGWRRMAPCAANAPSCPVYGPPKPFRFAIELLPADLKRSGLRVGAIVRLARG
jgi:uncharacterized membrane protein (UPF0127 family)